MELILNTYGVQLSRDNNAFVITSKESRQRIPVEGVTSLQICKGAQITSDAIFLAVENEIEVIFADRSGMPIGRVWSNQYGSISTIRKGQLSFSFSHDALVWIKEVICKKIENQEAILLMMQSDDDEINKHTTKSIVF